jgi:hypothetical protein
MIDLASLSAVAGAGVVTFTLSFRESHSGPIRVAYQVS